MRLRHILGGAVATIMAALLPSIPTGNHPTMDVIKHSMVGVAAVVSQVANPSATPIIAAQVVQAQWDSKSTPLGTTASLAIIAGSAIALKSIKKTMDSQLSNRSAVQLIQEIGLNTISMSMPLLAGGLVATAMGWQNLARAHNAIILPMLVPGIVTLIGCKLIVNRNSWKEVTVAAIGGVLAITASKYHPLAVGIMLGSVYCFQQKDAAIARELPNPSLYKWAAHTLETVEVPQWIQQCIYLGTVLIGVPVSQLYSIMQHGHPCQLSDKTKRILEGTIDSIETITSVVFYLLWGMAREGSFTDPMSKAMQNVPMQWYIPAIGILLVIGTAWYLYWYLELTIPIYLNYKVEGAAQYVSSLGMLFVGAQLLAVPLWLPVVGIVLGYTSQKLGIDISMLGSMMPLIGIGSK
jgi:hypothetical protein